MKHSYVNAHSGRPPGPRSPAGPHNCFFTRCTHSRQSLPFVGPTSGRRVTDVSIAQVAPWTPSLLTVALLVAPSPSQRQGSTSLQGLLLPGPLHSGCSPFLATIFFNKIVCSAPGYCVEQIKARLCRSVQGWGLGHSCSPPPFCSFPQKPRGMRSPHIMLSLCQALSCVLHVPERI